MTNEIKIIIDEEGNMKFTYSGFAGNLCYTEMEKLKKILKFLGIEIQITSQEPIPESYTAIKQVVKNVV